MADRADTEHRYLEAGRLDVLTFAMAMLMSNVRYLHSIHARHRAGFGRLRTSATTDQRESGLCEPAKAYLGYVVRLFVMIAQDLR